MKGKKVVFTLMVVALLVLPAAMTASAAGPGDPDTTITITDIPDDAPLECGSTKTSQILVTIVNQATDPKEVRGVEVHLTFDHTLLQVVDADPDLIGVQLTVERGLFDGDLHIGQNLVNNGTGKIDFAVAQSNGTPVFNAENKAIATITWQCAGECPPAPIKTEVKVVGNTLMSDPDGYPVVVDCVDNGTITIICPPVCIEGYVFPQGRYTDRSPDSSGVTVTAEKDGKVVASDITKANGYFKLVKLSPDTYEVYARMYGYLYAHKASGVQVVAGKCTDIGATKLLGGDVAPQPDPDCVIDIGDITYIASRFGEPDTPADINGDGVVNILDLTMAAANFLRICPTPWSMTP